MLAGASTSVGFEVNLAAAGAIVTLASLAAVELSLYTAFASLEYYIALFVMSALSAGLT